MISCISHPTIIHNISKFTNSLCKEHIISLLLLCEVVNDTYYHSGRKNVTYLLFRVNTILGLLNLLYIYCLVSFRSIVATLSCFHF